MSTLLTEILRNPSAVCTDGGVALRSAIRVNLQNVADFMYSHPRETWEPSEHIPSSAPPWPLMWGEFAVPRWSNDGGKKVDMDPRGTRVGLFAESKRTSTGGWRACVALVIKFLGAIVPCGAVFQDFSRDGVLVSGDTGDQRKFIVPPHMTVGGVASAIDTPETILLLAYSFCHCRNVVVRKVDAQDRESREARKRGQPVQRWHVLEVDAGRAVTVREGEQSEPKRHGVALHICRGHFARYTAEKPLFGHYVGTVWVPQHVKGAKEHGVSQKDYSVRPA